MLKRLGPLKFEKPVGKFWWIVDGERFGLLTSRKPYIDGLNRKKQYIKLWSSLVWWSFHRYKCLWDVEGKGRGSSLQKGASHTYTLRLG